MYTVHVENAGSAQILPIGEGSSERMSVTLSSGSTTHSHVFAALCELSRDISISFASRHCGLFWILLGSAVNQKLELGLLLCATATRAGAILPNDSSCSLIWKLFLMWNLGNKGVVWVLLSRPGALQAQSLRGKAQCCFLRRLQILLHANRGSLKKFSKKRKKGSLLFIHPEVHEVWCL